MISVFAVVLDTHAFLITSVSGPQPREMACQLVSVIYVAPVQMRRGAQLRAPLSVLATDVCGNAFSLHKIMGALQSALTSTADHAVIYSR